jgi:CRISPR system Cascade subunit CasA
MEFLIGLLTVAYPPGDQWAKRWKRPPSSKELKTAFAAFESVFRFGGDGPQAYQDLEDFDAEVRPIERLLIEAPGEASISKNTTLFVKSGRVDVLSLSAAAVALLTMQTMAPSGGSGHRTSLRGGGPLTTLIVPNGPPTLWHRLWANVSSGDRLPARAKFPRIFPWLAPTRLSDKGGRVTTPEDVDWRQVFFGMPRRIRLDLEKNVDRIPCDLTGVIEDVIVRTYRTLPHGVNYEAWGGLHPLTPHYRTKASDPVRNPVHGHDGRMGYRQWVPMLYGDKEGLREPATCVSFFIHERSDDLPPSERSFRLSAAGYATDNMKALAFVEAETPDLTIAAAEEQVAQTAKDFVAAANTVANALSYSLKIALYGERAEIRSDATSLTTARDLFWSDTNDAFFNTLNELSSLSAKAFAGDEATLASRNWRVTLERGALAIFDRLAPMHGAIAEVRRVVEGRRFLVWTLLGYGTRGIELFKNLQLPIPEKAKKKRVKLDDQQTTNELGARRPAVVG